MEIFQKMLNNRVYFKISSFTILSIIFACLAMGYSLNSLIYNLFNFQTPIIGFLLILISLFFYKYKNISSLNKIFTK
jgi:hypothetical protein